ncbi:hypothetical protein PVAG01_10797 [Phlyctema vagabunda]|uniref:Uncharacterized protein n=1 Tax=Phlyctema vagabunda TaxID=108571 RepID=A0ABR4P3N3_9HELO
MGRKLTYTRPDGELALYQFIPPVPSFKEKEADPWVQPANQNERKRKREETEEEKCLREREERSTMEVVHNMKPWDGNYVDCPYRGPPSEERLAEIFAALAITRQERIDWIPVEKARRAEIEKEQMANRKNDS